MLQSAPPKISESPLKEEPGISSKNVNRASTTVSIGYAIKKNLGLTILDNILCRRRKQEEKPKVAIHKSRRVAMSALLVHVAPVFTCIVLLYFNLHGYYIGSELTGALNQDSAKVNALQFASKLHEMTMVSSLTVIIFTLLRRKLVSSTRVPLSALVAGFQFTNIQYLWSKELWEAITPMVQSLGWFLVTILILATILVPLVGPASALLMIPRLEDWPAGGTRFYLNTNRDEIWPESVAGSDVPGHCARLDRSASSVDRSCPAGGWEAIKSGYAALNVVEDNIVEGYQLNSFFGDVGPFPIAGKTGLATMLVTDRASVAQLCISDAMIEAAQIWSTASEAGDSSPGRSFKFRRESTFYVDDDILQPWTGVTCVSQTAAANATLVTVGIGYGGSTTYDLNSTVLNSSRPYLEFVDSPEGLQASVGALVVLPAAAFLGTEGSTDGGDGVVVMSCAIRSRWIESKPYLTNKRSVQRSWTVNNNFEYPRVRSTEGSIVPIKMDADWARYLNPTTSLQNFTVFEELVYASPISGVVGDSALVERLLAAMATNGLARTGYNADVQGFLPDLSDSGWYGQILPKHVFGPGGQIRDTRNIDTSNMFQSTVKVTINGYGYWRESKTIIAAAIIIILYCCFTLPYVIFVAVSGVSYMSWDSIMELTALAIQSPKTRALHNTTAGIAGNATYKTPVKVRAVGDHVQLLFDDTETGDDFLEVDVAYS